MTGDVQHHIDRRATLEAEVADLRQRLALAEGSAAVVAPPGGSGPGGDAAFLRSVLASSNDCIKVLDLDGTLVLMSEGGQRTMEVSDFNAIRGCPWPDFWRGPGHADAKAAVEAAKAGRVGRFQGPADTMAGTPRFWDVQVTPIMGPDGRPERLLSISRDITATWLAETTLRDSEAALRLQREFLAAVIRQAPVGISISHARDGAEQIINDKAQALLGHGLLGHGADRYERYGGVHPDGTGYAVDDYPTMRALRRGEVIEREEMTYAVGGEGLGEHRVERRLEVSSSPVRDGSGEVVAAVTVFRDVEEDRRAEAALRRSEAHWRNLFARLEEGFILAEIVRGGDGVGRDWRYLHVNSAWTELVGLPREAAEGRTVRELIPGVEDVWIDEMVEVVETGEPATFTRQVGASGRWYEGRAFRLEGDQFAVIFHEVTSRLRTEVRQRALLELGDRLRDLSDPLQMASAAAEILGRTLEATRAGYGVMAADDATCTVEGDWNAEAVASVAGTHVLASFGRYGRDLMRGRTVVIGDVRTDPRTADDSSKLERLDVRSLVNVPIIEHGRLAAMLFVHLSRPHAWTQEEVSFIRDVAERARSEIERRRVERALNDLATSLEQQVLERTADRNRVWTGTNDLMGTAGLDGYLKEINPAWERALGSDRATLLARPFIELIHPDDHAETRSVVERLARGEAVTGFVDRLRVGEGECRTVMWDAVPAGDVFHIVGRDITEQRQTEERLRQSQKMEAVGQLTGGLAHDFNNLLTGIAGSLDLLQKRVAQGRINDLDRYLIAAQGASKRAAALTHRLLAFSRRQTLDPKPTDVTKLVQGMADLIRRTVGPEITVETVDTVGLWPALVDPNQLENAILNLCINARDAMPDGGRLTIETANKWMDDRAARERGVAPGQYLSLCVSDTGTGMPPDLIARVFEPFFTTKPLGQGTGLGLSMIYGFAQQSGGQVRIYSEVGMGTTVCIYLPRHFGAANGQEDLDGGVADVPRAGVGETVLVIDDEPTVRMLVGDVLNDLGYSALEAEDGPTGLTVLRSKVRIDLLVTDVGLPGGMNGRQVADAARVLRPGLKVLFITGYAENAVVGNGHLDPGMAVLSKPFAMDDLASKMRTLIEG